MLSKENRRQIMERIGKAIDELVTDLYSERIDGISAVQEAEITSRLCQRLEDQLDNSRVGDYVFRVIAQSLPDRGPKSMERVIGADLFLSVSLEGHDGFDKGIFIQAKYDRNLDRGELKDACRRMRQVAGSKGAYVWIYEADGVRVVSSHQVSQMRHNTLADVVPRSATGFFGRILDCYAGNRSWGIPNGSDRREAVATRLRETRANNLLDIKLKKSRP
ncbi:hypothetical protein [Mesorhizobium marinum]|uniref:Restriction endonuclease type IV Mrr domain-containing protein n=1 Tax=Mesorhizobium marinum TaxID=3228790 RepID=A0ABV3R057_9HYPH